MKRLILSIVLSVITAGWVCAQEPAGVFIYAGQSNADGRVYNSELPDYLKPGYDHLHYANVTSSSTGEFGSRTFTNMKERWAFCDVTNYCIEQTLKTGFYAVKCTYGGTAGARKWTEYLFPPFCSYVVRRQCARR